MDIFGSLAQGIMTILTVQNILLLAGGVTLGMIVGVSCALLGGVLVRLWGARSVMVLALVLQAMALAGLATAA